MVSMAYSSPDEDTSSLLSSLMPNPNDLHTPLNADVGVTYTAGMHDQLVAQVLLTYARGDDCAALGVPHHIDRTLPMPVAGHVYLQTTRQWEGKHFRNEQKRPRIPDGMRCAYTSPCSYIPQTSNRPDDQAKYIAAHNSYFTPDGCASPQLESTES